VERCTAIATSYLDSNYGTTLYFFNLGFTDTPHETRHRPPRHPTLRELMQLLHEEIGLPEHKTISLKTAINLDLGCNGA
jgi:hypothetical protein